MHCPSCQREHPDGMKFCPVTGTRLTRSETVDVNPQRTYEFTRPEPSVTWKRSITLAFQKYAIFSGRSTRAEYWWLYLTVALTWTPCLVFILIGLPTNSYELGVASGVCGLIAGIINLVFMLPLVSCGVRRLHDSNKSGWHLLWGLIPYVGWIVPLVMLVQPTQSGSNRFGKEPVVE